MAITSIYVLLTHGSVPITYLLLPVLFSLQLLAMVGVGFFLSAASVFFRDLKDIVQLFAQVGLFLMPVVYLPDMVPALFRPILYVNPFSYMTWAYQDALYYGRIEHPHAWFVFATASLFAFAAGFRVFRRLKPMFGSVL
jgi:lipopolysaccharide transport system permease protein